MIHNRLRSGDPSDSAPERTNGRLLRLGEAMAAANDDDRPWLITGGAGFIGTNLADRLVRLGRRVILYDNLSRPGVQRNADYLLRQHGERVQIEVGDILDEAGVRRCVQRCGRVFHFAAQVAVTSSVADPIHDFEVNARGTLNVLEAVRRCSEPPPLLFTSTNKVYGDLRRMSLVADGSRYEPADRFAAAGGVDEQALDFHSPYGCSKGAADQYVLDYAHTYGLRNVVFRMSCIYGPHQCGNEDQGWVAHFLIRALCGEPITIYGDGRQVRDLLYAADLIDAMLMAHAKIEDLSGRAFNIGGGAVNSISLLELLDLIENIHGEPLDVRYGDWRVGDQRYYVSSTARFREATGWVPAVCVRRGVGRLYEWLREHHLPAARPLPAVDERPRGLQERRVAS